MRITSLDIPKDAIEDNGLDRIVMRCLGRVVVLAGPNGSGKTRLLRKIRGICDRYPSPQELEAVRREIRLHGMRRTISPHQQKQLEERLAQLEKRVACTEWITFSSGDSPKKKCFDWVPKHVDLRDSNRLTRGQIITCAKACEGPGLDRIHENALARIQHVQDVRREVTNPEYQGEDREAALESYERLRKLVKDVLGTELGRDTDGNALVFGRPVAKAGLSDGQNILLQFCVALHAQGGTLGDTVLLMDEPENHLHPSVIVDVIDRVSQQLGDGQLWIATHSLPLIAQFGPESVWYMDEGRVSYAGQTPEKVLNGLLGGEDRAHNLVTFVDLPAAYAANRFAFECLKPPGTVPLREGDPQMAQVKAAIESGGGCRILDFGAGQGRLASSLLDAFGTAAAGSIKTWDYVAYDHDDKDRAACEAAIERLYGESQERWFNDLHALIGSRGEGAFDAVVMCNVLHEIEPAEWLDLFDRNGPLLRLMSSTGFLLIVEDQRMPVGEKAHAKGFLVLDTDEIRTLFGIASAEDRFAVDATDDGRLKAHQVPRRCLPGISADTRRKVLVQVQRRAKDEIKRLRKAAQTFSNGRLHAYWVQQLANATLVLDELGPP